MASGATGSGKSFRVELANKLRNLQAFTNSFLDSGRWRENGQEFGSNKKGRYKYLFKVRTGFRAAGNLKIERRVREVDSVS